MSEEEAKNKDNIYAKILRDKFYVAGNNPKDNRLIAIPLFVGSSSYSDAYIDFEKKMLNKENNPFKIVGNSSYIDLNDPPKTFEDLEKLREQAIDLVRDEMLKERTSISSIMYLFYDYRKFKDGKVLLNNEDGAYTINVYKFDNEPFLSFRQRDLSYKENREIKKVDMPEMIDYFHNMVDGNIESQTLHQKRIR